MAAVYPSRAGGGESGRLTSDKPVVADHDKQVGVLAIAKEFHASAAQVQFLSLALFLVTRALPCACETISTMMQEAGSNSGIRR